jgi:hypothetical protein
MEGGREGISLEMNTDHFYPRMRRKGDGERAAGFSG